MEKFKKVFYKATDVTGVIFPCIIFMVLFLTFIATIGARYIFSKSLTWGNELAVICYIWIMFWGCGKAMENDEHVVFSLVYDTLKPKGQMIMKVIYNILLAVLMACAIKPCVTALLASTQITGVLKLPYKIIFAPFIWMMFAIIIRSIINIPDAIKEYKEAIANPAPAKSEEEKEGEA